MSKEQIIKLVAKTLGVNQEMALNSNTPDCIDARNIMITIMLEENYSFWEVIEGCKIHRTSFYAIKKSIDSRLGKDIPFSKKYVKCIAAIVAIEEKEDLEW